MAQKTDVGVPRDPAADIQAVPTVTDIGVPTEGLINIDPNNPGQMTDDRIGTNPDQRYGDSIGVGTPINPADGVISE